MARRGRREGEVPLSSHVEGRTRSSLSSHVERRGETSSSCQYVEGVVGEASRPRRGRGVVVIACGGTGEVGEDDATLSQRCVVVVAAAKRWWSRR